MKVCIALPLLGDRKPDISQAPVAKLPELAEFVPILISI
jgi:hypothetical protein